MCFNVTTMYTLKNYVNVEGKKKMWGQIQTVKHPFKNNSQVQLFMLQKYITSWRSLRHMKIIWHRVFHYWLTGGTTLAAIIRTHNIVSSLVYGKQGSEYRDNLFNNMARYHVHLQSYIDL